MATAISLDLRARVTAACLQEGATYEEAAARFGVGRASVSRWLRLYCETEALEPRPLPGRVPRIDEAGEALVLELVRSRPDATLAELAEAFRMRTSSRPLATCIMYRALDRMGLTRKKRRSALQS